jgi:hypothetical protein
MDNNRYDTFGFGLLSDSRPAFSYARITSKLLRYTYQNADSSWTDEPVAPLDNDGTTWLTFNDLVVLPNDMPAIAYSFRVEWNEYQLRDDLLVLHVEHPRYGYRRITISHSSFH